MSRLRNPCSSRSSCRPETAASLSLRVIRPASARVRHIGSVFLAQSQLDWRCRRCRPRNWYIFPPRPSTHLFPLLCASFLRRCCLSASLLLKPSLISLSQQSLVLSRRTFATSVAHNVHRTNPRKGRRRPRGRGA